jgi:hypothetical protein
MKTALSFLFSILLLNSFGQNEPVTIIEEKKEELPPAKVFYSQKVINTKTVEVLRKGVMEFNVSHSFGDIAGDAGGIQRFFGLDNATDIRIGFQTGLSDKLNLITARTKGAGFVQNQWELGLKYQFLKQMENDPKRPLSLTLFVNNVLSTQKRSPLPNQENSFENFGDRHSQVIQLMLARKFGKVSLQLNPIYLHTAYVIPGDDKSIFALGGAIRLPLSKKIILLADYFHPFRSQSSKDFFAQPSQGNIKFYNPLGIGFEILTEGHVFHLNFTNAAEILENRFVRRTVTSWGDGEFRWAFTISRNFILFREKKSK